MGYAAGVLLGIVGAGAVWWMARGDGPVAGVFHRANLVLSAIRTLLVLAVSIVGRAPETGAIAPIIGLGVINLVLLIVHAVALSRAPQAFQYGRPPPIPVLGPALARRAGGRANPGH